MVACWCSICNGRVAPDSELARLDLFDLRVADGHLAAATVQDLRTLDPAVKHHVCSNCATLLARRQRLLNVSLKAEAEMELDEWAASLMPPATEKPTCVTAEGVVNKTTNQSDNVTTSSAFQPGSLTGSSLGIKKDVTVIKIVRLAPKPHIPTVKLENMSCLVACKAGGAPDLVATNVEGLVDLGDAKREIVSGPGAGASDNAMHAAKCGSDPVAVVQTSGAPHPAAAQVKHQAGGRGGGATQLAGCGCVTCSRCRDARKAEFLSASVEHHLSVLARSSSERNKNMNTERCKPPENSAAGDCSVVLVCNQGHSSAQNCSKHNVEACQPCKMAIGPFREAKGYHGNKRGRLRCVSCVECFSCQAAKSKQGTQQGQIARFVVLHCTFCNLNLESMTALLYHLDVHNNLASSPSYSGMSQTGMTVTSGEDHSKTKQLRCHICCAPFLNVIHLLRHLDVHNAKYTKCRNSNEIRQDVASTSLRSFICSGCGTQLRSKFQLDRHRAHECLTALGVCPYCDFEPICKKRLRPHIQLHVIGTGKCQTCDITMADGVGLRRHQSECIGRKFVCELCGRRFRKRFGLKRHMQQCHKTASYCCHLCPASFYVIDALRTHLKQHDPDADLQCGRCPARFPPQALKKFRAHITAHKKSKIRVPDER